jgi:cellulase/cellobiase CelA1
VLNVVRHSWAADAVTGGDAHDLLVNQWRLPGNCGQSPLSASISINPAWNNGYCASVTVTNGGAQTTTSWTAVVGLNQSQLTNSWCANVSTSNGQLTAGSLGWNGTLAPGANTTFGFCANKTGANWTPAVISVH